MKKILSLTLAALMLFSMVPTAMAADYTEGTQVTYSNAEAAESYTVTVPATLTVGGSGGNVTASGTWAANRKLVVETSSSHVDLLNSINNSDRFILPVTFNGISLVGSNTAAVTDTEVISVDYDMSAEALFGTWSGIIEYDVEMVDAEMIKFRIQDNNGTLSEYSVLEGTTWASLTRGGNSDFSDGGDQIEYFSNGVFIGCLYQYDEYGDYERYYGIYDEIVANAVYNVDGEIPE